MLLILAQIIGFAAVGLYLLSYQLKRRTQIVWVTFASNVFYVLQYCLLGAFSGALMDMLATCASFFAAKKHAPAWRKHNKKLLLTTLIAITAVGLTVTFLQKDPIELIPIAGAIFQTISLWCDDEQTLRKLGLCSTPFWLVYNFISQAYGAALGSILVTISIVTSLIRYRKNNP